MSARKTRRTLTGSRIYQRRQRFAFFSPIPLENPRTGRVTKWHALCPVAHGELKARQLAAEIIAHNRAPKAEGDLPAHIERYRMRHLARREDKRPKEAARVKIFDANNKEFTRVCKAIADGFSSFDVAQVMPVDVAEFVDQWEGQRMAAIYLSRLSDFFRWCIRRGLRPDNPCADIEVEKPKKRTRYLNDAEWHAVRDSLLIGNDSKPTQSGPMVQCYVDLCYLLYQRVTEIRLLKWPQVDMAKGVIYFTPTKTEESSGLSVAVPITPAVRAVLERAKRLGTVKGIYVIHNRKGQPYTKNGIGVAWLRACKRAEVINATSRDIRSKAATDAKKVGYTLGQIQVGLAHTSEQMTAEYIRVTDAPESVVALALPKRPQT